MQKSIGKANYADGSPGPPDLLSGVFGELRNVLLIDGDNGERLAG